MSNSAYVFAPSDRSASSVEEFLAVCAVEPDIAANHLASGYFAIWLRDQGRPDLADLADDARGSLVEAGPPAMLDRFLAEARKRPEPGSRRATGAGTASRSRSSGGATSTAARKSSGAAASRRSAAASTPTSKSTSASGSGAKSPAAGEKNGTTKPTSGASRSTSSGTKAVSGTKSATPAKSSSTATAKPAARKSTAKTSS